MYRHTQVGGWLILGGGALAAVAGLVAGAWPFALLPLLVIAVVWALFGTLTVTVDQAGVSCQFGPVGVIRRRLALAEIRRAAAIRTSPLWGWGLRLTPRGWLWNVSGLDAVEFEMTNGTRFAVGTDEPQALIAALRRAGVSG
jgi:hypothetical protein